MSDCEHKRLKCRDCMRNGDLKFFTAEASALLSVDEKEELLRYYIQLKEYVELLGWVDNE